MRALAATKTMEVIINFPVYMAIDRLIPRNPEKMLPTTQPKLDKFFGGPEWYDVAYEANVKRENVAKLLLEFYLHRLRKLFKFVEPSPVIRGTKNRPLYHLIWAGQDSLGQKLASDILNREFKRKTDLFQGQGKKPPPGLFHASEK